jgi:hypothetical protein
MVDSFVVDAGAQAPSVAARFPVSGLVPVTSARQLGDDGHALVTRW